MHAKTMEGLTGARTNMNLVNTPMHFFKAAKRRDDTVTMERSIGHAAKFAGKAKEYRAKAKKGMAEDAKEAREQAALARENAIKNRQAERSERVKPENRFEADKPERAESSKPKEERNVFLKSSAHPDNRRMKSPVFGWAGMYTAKNGQGLYTKTGKTGFAGQTTGFSMFG